MYFLPIILMVMYFLIEKLMTDHHRKKIKYVIHVNGIRGKSTIVKMVDSVLREAGYNTYAKTTGTVPEYHINGESFRIHRKGLSNIREQRKHLIKASKSGSDALIIECMALRPESQKVSEQILRSDIGIISNVRTDHLEVMGLTHQDIKETLRLMTPKHGILIEGDTLSDTHLSFDHLHQQNVNIAYEVSKYLNISEDAFAKALSKMNPSISSSSFDFQLTNGFTANDLETTQEMYQSFVNDNNVNSAIWFNDRYDRPLRSKLLSQWLLTLEPSTIYLTGDGIRKNKRKLCSKHIIVTTLDEVKSTCVFGMGNIKGLEYILES
ncbi:MAG: hypothetical protein JEZ08_01365 [Clostridiales bacterium]|nr:hypothetical protein [Clostridiales bacterium]